MRSGVIAVLLTAAAIMIHATRGIVQTVDARTLVIARFGHRGNMTFNVTPETHWEGVVVVGSTVSVRYREEGKDHVATAITLQPAKD
jgi:hypothetical protein